VVDAVTATTPPAVAIVAEGKMVANTVAATTTPGVAIVAVAPVAPADLASFAGVLRSSSRGSSSSSSPSTSPSSRGRHTTSDSGDGGDCLCVFDVDRVLTGKQGEAASCPGNEEKPGTRDASYLGGTLVVSRLGQRIHSTFCSRCYKSVVSSGFLTGDDSIERKQMLDMLGGPMATLSTVWSGPDTIISPLVVGAVDGRKHETVRKIVNWFKEHRTTDVAPSQVFFFDDREDNVVSFRGTGYNARQVSCKSRETGIGLCGATPDEVVKEKGVKTCDVIIKS